MKGHYWMVPYKDDFLMNRKSNIATTETLSL
jgi:hypothetical protein